MYKVLLPPNYQENQFWLDYTDAVTELFNQNVDVFIREFSYLRDTYVYQHNAYWEQPSYGHFDYTNFYPFEKQEYVSRNNFHGFTFKDSFFDTTAYQILSSNISQYYRQKGTPAFLSFFSFSLSTGIEAEACWTQDYATFKGELTEAGSIGTRLDRNGTWYPTTHVNLTASMDKFVESPEFITKFFDYIAPLNLVMHQLNLASSSYIKEDGADIKFGMASIMTIIL